MLRPLFEIGDADILVRGVGAIIGVFEAHTDRGNAQGIHKEGHGPSGSHGRLDDGIKAIDLLGCLADHLAEGRVERGTSWILPFQIDYIYVGKAVLVEVPSQLHQNVLRSLIRDKAKIALSSG